MLIKIKPLKINKIWGYEKWVYSSYPGRTTNFSDTNTPVPSGPLIKIIKTNQPLSIQVHPDDFFAKKLENKANGKSESWYILKSQTDSELILGMKNYDKNFIINNIEKPSFLHNLITIKAEVNDFYNIPAGLVHGLGANITVLEVQQCSDVTYRYYDYNRLQNGKPRELHLKKALTVQKDLSYVLKPKIKKPLTYEMSYAKLTFLKGKNQIEKNNLIIDLKNEQGYWIKNHMVVNLENYVLVTW